jgi:hypothetical protein
MMPAFQYVRVRSVEEGIRHLSSGDARVHAGGTDLLGCLRENVFTTAKVVSISNIKELKGIREERGGLRIGALSSLTEVAESPLVKKLYPGLAQAAMEVGSPQRASHFHGSFVPKGRSVEISAKNLAAGTTGATSIASARAATLALPLPGRTSTIAFSEVLPAILYTRQTRLLPCQPSRQRSASWVPRVQVHCP